MNNDYCINSNNKKWNDIMKDYKDTLLLCFTDESIPFCRYDLGNIYFKYDTFKNPDEEDLFDLLHEIGHCMTNEKGMKRCLEEYLATQWALDHMKKYNVKITRKRIEKFQKYIFKWREIGIKHGGKNMPTVEQLKLRY